MNNGGKYTRKTYWEVEWGRPFDRGSIPEVERFVWTPGKDDLNIVQARARAFAQQKALEIGNDGAKAYRTIKLREVEERVQDMGTLIYEDVINQLGQRNEGAPDKGDLDG